MMADIHVAITTSIEDMRFKIQGIQRRHGLEHPSLLKLPGAEIDVETLRILLHTAVDVVDSIPSDMLQSKHSVIRGALYRLRTKNSAAFDHLKLALSEIESHIPVKKDEENV